MFFRKLWASMRGRWPAEHRTDYRQLESRPINPDEALQQEYERLVRLVLRRWRVPESCASVEIIRMGEGRAGRQTFVAALRILEWERSTALRLLLGLPLLERKIRKAVRAHWVADVSRFGGVWLHAAERLCDAGADADLRDLLATLRPTDDSGAKLRA